MQYLLDTDAFSDIVRRLPYVYERFCRTPPSQVRISSVTLKEIEYGRRLSPERVARHIPAIESLLRRIDTIPFDVEEAHAAGRLRAFLARAGTPIGPYDVMIAATALAHGLTLVSANTMEFSRVPGLQLDNWRVPANEVRESPAEYRVSGKCRYRQTTSNQGNVNTALAHQFSTAFVKDRRPQPSGPHR
jgi:tRNA(fMet)-specific endonuclease VapC